MPTLITTTPQKWRGKLIAKNAEVEATEQEARVLLALGRAKVKPAQETARKYTTPVELQQENPPAKRAYKRKDIEASPEQAVVTPETDVRWDWPKRETQ